MADLWKANVLYLITYKPIVESFELGSPIRFERNGVLHNVEFPALIEKISQYGNKSIHTREFKYYRNGVLHREDYPAYIIKDHNGKIRKIGYFENGKKHRSPSINGEDRPAEKIYYPNGKISEESYYINGKRHRSQGGGPAKIEYYENGNIKYEYYFIDNINYRNDILPSIIGYDEKGSIVSKWYHNSYGKLHRSSIMIGDKEKHRPAYISYKNDNIEEVKYSINGVIHRPPPSSSLSYKERKKLGDYGGPAFISDYYGSKIISYYSYGKLHRPPILSVNNKMEHLPAYIKYHRKSNVVKIEEYYVNGLLHRDPINGYKPAFIKYRKNGQILIEKYYARGVLHRPDGPILIRYFKDGRPKKMEYRLHGVLHRHEGPANIFYYGRCNSVRLEEWWIFGKLQKMIKYDPDCYK